MVSRRCVLCGKKRSNLEQKIYYHTFPKKSLEVRNKWLEFCGMEEPHLNTISSLCSIHFKEEDLISHLDKRIVKRGALPCFKSFKMRKRYYERKQKMLDDMVLMPTAKHLSSPSNSKQEYLHSESADVNQDSEMQVEINFIDVHGRAHVKKIKTSSKPLKDSCEISNASSPDLSTTRKAEKVLKMAKAALAKQTHKIRMLQQSQRRLREQVAALQALIDKNLEFDSAAESILIDL